MSQHSRCQFFVTRKNRQCKMLASKSGFCGEHLPASLNTSKGHRIPCPLNPKQYTVSHYSTCFENELDSHLQKCNANKPLHHSFKKGINDLPSLFIVETKFENFYIQVYQLFEELNIQTERRYENDFPFKKRAKHEI